MKKMMRLLAMLAVLTLVAAACGGSTAESAATGDDDTETTDDGGGDDGGSDDSGGDDTETVDAAQGSDLTFHMITHSDDGPFWSVVNRGMDAACSDLGVTCVWVPGNNDANVMVQGIEGAIGEGTDGIAASLPDPAALVPALTGAVDGGVPVVTLNSGANDYQDIGALTHVGQTEFIAGQAAGELSLIHI